jgi:hypothetical protein
MDYWFAVSKRQGSLHRPLWPVSNSSVLAPVSIARGYQPRFAIFVIYKRSPSYADEEYMSGSIK